MEILWLFGYCEVSFSLLPVNGMMWVEVGPWQRGAFIPLLLACLAKSRSGAVSTLLHNVCTCGRNRIPSVASLATAAHGRVQRSCQG